ncbi:MAG TPA: OmpA family protein [Thermoanaerobaculia bacterium]|nr:OmpA family protein [Thermoanaerobaculia bacterium]
MRQFGTRGPRSQAPARAPSLSPAAPRFAFVPSMHRLAGSAPPAAQLVQRTPDQRRDPARFETLHENLFVAAPTQTGAPRKTWEGAKSEAQILKEFKDSILQEVERNPLRAVGQMKRATTQQDAETAAIDADKDLHARYPQIPAQLSEASIRGRVTVFAPDFEPQNAPSGDFLGNWVDNQLPIRTSLEEFDLDPGHADYKKLVQSLAKDTATFPIDNIVAAVRTLAEKQGLHELEVLEIELRTRSQIEKKSWSWLFNRLSSRTAAFEGHGKVFVSESLDPKKRRPTLLHELIHAYAHDDYRRWVDGTTSQRMFNEGFTEILTREVLTKEERDKRTSYQGSVDVINARVMPYISLDDLAKAFFRGEVWRIEGKSAVSQEMFEKQVGLAAGAARPEEVKQSQGGAGIVQTVEEGSFFRLLNFGTDQSKPKAEHEAFLRDVLVPRMKSDSKLRARFVGHADETGPAGHNEVLARGRAQAVYRLALKLGIPREQLLDVNKPAGGGEKEPTAGNDNVHGRAMNRRVEVFVTSQP